MKKQAMNECNLEYLYLINKLYLITFVFSIFLNELETWNLKLRSHGTPKVLQRAIGFEANTPVQYSPLVQVVKSKTLVVRFFKVCDWFK